MAPTQSSLKPRCRKLVPTILALTINASLFSASSSIVTPENISRLTIPATNLKTTSSPHATYSLVSATSPRIFTKSMSKLSTISMSATTSANTNANSWFKLQSVAANTAVGAALNTEAKSRENGTGAPFVQNKLRLFNSKERPRLTLFRDHAGWCPYCQKSMLLIEEKQIPINIELVPMRSYGDKPQSFLRMVPSGLLPALLIESEDGEKEIVTESQVIMELLDQWHSEEEGYKPMVPREGDVEGMQMYRELARLERELFSWWCELIFRPERMGMGGGGNLFSKLTRGGEDALSGSMKGFLDCLSQVDAALSSTSGPWFFDFAEYPTMIDFIYVSHVERMLASCAFWKGLDLRSETYRRKFPALNAWIDAFEKRECYLAFKSDYYTHVKDIPPQYGPGYDGGFETDRMTYQKNVLGRDGKSWNLPLNFDDELQPLYRGPPLPLCVLKAAGIAGDDGVVGGEGTSYENADEEKMLEASRHMAGWKLAENGENVAKFAARGGPKGAQNPRKGFGAELADPYAAPDEDLIPYVDMSLQSVCRALLADSGNDGSHIIALKEMRDSLTNDLPKDRAREVAGALAYLRDRVGVPRDLPLAAARQMRAHLNAAIDVLC